MGTDIKNMLASRITNAGGRLRVRSALNPMLWLCALVAMPTLLLASFAPSPPDWLIWLVVGPVGITSFGFLYLLILDPDKLQSEEYQIRKQTLELIEQKGMETPIISTADLPAITPESLLSNEAEKRS